LPTYTPRQKGTLLEVENVQDDFRIAIPQHDVPSNGDAFAIRRWRGKAALQFDRNDDHTAFQARRKRTAKHKLSLQSGRKAVFPGETRREVSVIFTVPTPKFASVMFREPVPTAILIVVVVFVSIPVPPMPIVVIAPAILVVLVLICKNRVSWKHKESENDGRKPCSSVQEFPPKRGGLGFQANAEDRQFQDRKGTLFPGSPAHRWDRLYVRRESLTGFSYSCPSNGLSPRQIARSVGALL
jgi:hypothetical protein